MNTTEVYINFFSLLVEEALQKISEIFFVELVLGWE